LNFDEDLLQPTMVIAYWDALASEFTKRHIVQDVLYQKDHASSSTTEFFDLYKESLKVTRSEARSFDA